MQDLDDSLLVQHAPVSYWDLLLLSILKQTQRIYATDPMNRIPYMYNEYSVLTITPNLIYTSFYLIVTLSTLTFMCQNVCNHSILDLHFS